MLLPNIQPAERDERRSVHALGGRTQYSVTVMDSWCAIDVYRHQ